MVELLDEARKNKRAAFQDPKPVKISNIWYKNSQVLERLK